MIRLFLIQTILMIRQRFLKQYNFTGSGKLLIQKTKAEIYTLYLTIIFIFLTHAKCIKRCK